MSLPLRVAVIGKRGSRRVAAGLLVLVTLVLPVASPWAQQPPSPAAQQLSPPAQPPSLPAQQAPSSAPPPTAAPQPADPYSATVKVDATAANTAAAQKQARLDGQRQALMQVLAGLAGGDVTTLGKLSDQDITNMVVSFEVADERMSAVRYTADLTFHFSPEGVRGLLQRAGVAPTAPAAGGGQPVVILPVYQFQGRTALWGDPNPWRDAWQQMPPTSGPVHLVVPLGDASDLAAIDSARAVAGDPGALAAIARKSGAGDVVVALATVRQQGDQIAGLNVTLKRYRQGQPAGSNSQPVEAQPGESMGALMARAAAAVANAIENGTEGGANQAEVPATAPSASLDAGVAITSLADWVRVRTELANLPAVRKVALTSLSRQEATVQIQYVGTIDELKSKLAAVGLTLVPGTPMWQIAPAGAAPPH